MRIFTTGIFLLLFLAGCQLQVEVEESNMSISEGYEIKDSFGFPVYAELPSPNGEIKATRYNETHIRITNEKNETIGFDDITDGKFQITSPSVSVKLG